MSPESNQPLDIFPLTSYQQDIWLEQTLNPNNPLCNIGARIEIKGPFDYKKLNQAINKAISDNDALRIQIKEENGKPYQVFIPELKYELPYYDFSDKSNSVEYAKEWLQERFLEVFELDDLLFDFALLKVDEEHFFLFTKTHHIIADGWGITQLNHRIESYYNNINDALNGNEENFSFKAIIEKNTEYLLSENYQKDIEFWKKEYASTPDPLFPPTNNSEDSTQITNKRTQFLIKRSKYDEITDLCAKNNCTEFHYFLGVISLYFSRLYGRDEIVIDIPVLNRSKKERLIIGHCMNILPLRISISNTSTFGGLLKDIKTSLTKSYRHYKLSYGQIFRGLKIENRDFSDILLSFEIYDRKFNYISTASYTDTLSHQHEQRALNIQVNPSSVKEDVVISIDYLLEIFNDQFPIENVISHLKIIIDETLQDSEKQINNVEILTKGEKHKLLTEWNNTKADYPKDKCIHQLFEEQVKKMPDNIAVVFENIELTYRELNDKSNQLAHYLQSKGLKPDSLVGICVDRSLEMIVGLLGILKAGGAYVPIDPTYPKERISYIVEDADCEIILSQKYIELPKTNSKIIYLDADWDEIESESIENVKSEVQSDHLVYVIYTSGSTGRPKGVMIEHSSLVNLSLQMIKSYRINPHDAILQFASFTFDMSVEEIFPSLISGAKLVVPSVEIKETSTYFKQYCIKNQVTILNLPPQLWAYLVGEDIIDSLNLVRLIAVGGDEIKKDALIKWQERYGEFPELWNAYGPTENTVNTTLHSFRKGDKVSIGKAIANTNVYILDKEQNLSAIGVAGELCISGVGLARGYLKQAEFTAEKFIQNPFSDDPNSRLYKSGDLVRYLADGNIEFIGRVDDQVKIRGFRVELGEIESILNKIESVENCVVIAKQDQDGNKRLVAYIVSERELNVQELRMNLSESLPDYMIPSLFVSLDKMPLTPRGKIDKKALPEPEGNIETTNEYVAPRNKTEQKLADIWQKVLGADKIGIHDNFFELGGHSLLATQVISKIRTEFNIELPLKTLFEKPDLLNLSETIENTNLESNIAKITLAQRDVDLPLSFAQERLWFIDQYEHNASYNIPGAVKLIGKLDVDVLEKTFAEIIRRHEVLRTNFVSIDNKPSQLIHKDSKFELITVDQSHLPEEEASQKILELIETESQIPFDLANDSLMRLVLYKISDEAHILFLNKHHIISDGWSYSVLFSEVSILYKSFSENKPSPLAELQIQYADYAVWQREHIEGDVLNKQSEYWKNKLSNTAILELPTDKIRPDKQTFKGASLHLSLDKDLTEKLNTFSKENDVSLFMTLLSAFKVLLNKYSGQEDICVGSPIANRTRNEIEPLIGFFANTLALRSDLSGNIRFVDLLKQIKQTTLDAYDNQDIPFEKVVELVQPERNLSYSPLFQVMMVLQNTPSSELSFGELSLKPIEFESRISKFDLLLNLSETVEGFVGSIEYNTDLFNKDRIERMIEHFKVLINSMISNPTVNISDLEILTPEEKHKLLVEWNDTQADYSKDICIHQLFEEQVEKTPDNVATVFENKQLSYRELNEKSNQLAHYLQSKGVKPDSLVGICVDRSLEMIIGLLGILKAGGAYVPIDPTYPEDRISFMIEDADCEIVLTQKHIELPKTNSEIIYLDADWDKIENGSIINPQSEVQTDHLVYVIYTSGSTGRPKGVMLEHRNISNLINYTLAKTNIDLSSVLQFASLSFDVSAQEIFSTLSYGGKLCLINNEVRLNMPELSRVISTHDIKTVYWPVSLTKMIFSNGHALIPQSIDHIITAGEQLVVNPNFSKYLKDNGTYLHNHYGPSETHAVTTLTISPNDNHIEYPSIGKPISNTSAYILNKEGHLVPINVVGELYVSGHQIGRGYIKQTDLTAEKFIRNPFSEDPNSRLYRTGDLVKYLHDGNIEFIGRVDNQIKIRGFRVELGEVESVLNKIESVEDAVVIAKQGQDGNKRLVAYIVSNSELKIQELRENLSKSMPDYMIPSLFVELETMPLTPNGKIDKEALPELEGNIETTNEYVAPRNEIEQKLANIWMEVLNVQKVGVYDNFFELGGHSLLLTVIQSKINDKLSIQLPIKVLFEYSSIDKLYSYLKLVDISFNKDDHFLNKEEEIEYEI